MDTPKPGGLRNPAGGRPRIEAGERKVKISVTVSPHVHHWLLAQRQRPHEPLSQVVDRILARVAEGED
jgi:hypothetical protein